MDLVPGVFLVNIKTFQLIKNDSRVLGDLNAVQLEETRIVLMLFGAGIKPGYTAAIFLGWTSSTEEWYQPNVEKQLVFGLVLRYPS